MTKWLILLTTLTTAYATAAPAWKWVDADGTVHYSDRPVPGAEQVELPTGRGFRAAIAAASQVAAAPPSEPAAEPVAPYRLFEIVSPAPMQTLWNIGAVLTVQVALEPELQNGHTLDVLYDGQAQHLDAGSTTMQVREVYRGLHTIQAVVYDAGGEEMGRSAPVEFVVQQTSIQNPNNPNRPRSPVN